MQSHWSRSAENEAHPQPVTAVGATPPTPPPPGNDEIGMAEFLTMLAQWLRHLSDAGGPRFTVEYDGARITATLGPPAP